MVSSARSGFSLVEVLVSLFVLTTGVLAAVALHLTALQTARQSALHTHALHLATDLAESMRADLREAMPQASALEMDVEMRAWLQRVRDELPDGRAQVCRDAAPWDAAVRRLRWDCLPDDASGEGPLVIKIGWRDRMRSATLPDDTPHLALTVRPADR